MHYLSEKPHGPSKTYTRIFRGSALQITSAGFQFLLHSPHAQLWDLLLEYLHMAEVSLIFGLKAALSLDCAILTLAIRSL